MPTPTPKLFGWEKRRAIRRRNLQCIECGERDNRTLEGLNLCTLKATQRQRGYTRIETKHKLAGRCIRCGQPNPERMNMRGQKSSRCEDCLAERRLHNKTR